MNWDEPQPDPQWTLGGCLVLGFLSLIGLTVTVYSLGQICN